MIKKLVAILLLVVMSQATFAANASMHFPGTAEIDSLTFNGTATVEGFGSDTTSIVSLVLSSLPPDTPPGLVGTGPLTADCQNHGGQIVPAQAINVSVLVTAPPQHPNRNGKATFDFKNIQLASTKSAGCPNGNWQVVNLAGRVFATYYARQISSTNQLVAKASLGFQCDIDESVSIQTKCVEIFETQQTCSSGHPCL